MAFNPKEARKGPAPRPLNIPSNGKPAVVFSAGKMLEVKAMEELKYNPGAELKPIVPGPAPPKKQDYLIEWWKLGTNETDIQSAIFSCSRIKPFIKTFLKSGKYSLIYLERQSDNKVIWDRRR